MAHAPIGKNKAYESMSSGWALSSSAFKRELLQEHNLAALNRDRDAQGVKEQREAGWQDALQRALTAVPVTQCKDQRKSAAWKVAVASCLKTFTDVSNG